MKNQIKLIALLLLGSLLILNACKKDKPEPADNNSFDALKTFMMAEGLDLPDLLSEWIVEATPLNEGGIVDTENGCTIPGYHVFDIRSSDHFNAGHINGAINVSLANIVDEAAAYTDKPILVVCVSGQSAGHGVMALRLLGYSDAKVLKWGMCGWSPDFEASWANNVGNIGVGSPKWVTTAAPAPGTFTNPTWTSTFINGIDILAERVDFMLNNGFKAASPADVLNSPGNYQIINFWDNTDYVAFGHYTGAYQIKPISLASDITKAFDPSVQSAVYCYTGQTSSMATAWLNVLGYDFLSIKFGVNALNYDGLEAAGKPHWHGPADFDYVTSK